MASNTRGFGLFENLLSGIRARVACRFIPEQYYGGRILDIGCGSKPYFLMSIPFKEKFAVDQIKPSERGDIRFLCIELGANKRLPYDDNYFDAVTALAFIEHLDGVSAEFLIKELFRVLKKNGVIVLTTPSRWTQKLLEFLSAVKMLSPDEIKEHKHLYSQKELAQLLCGSGFDPGSVKTGSFELFMNLYAAAKK